MAGEKEADPKGPTLTKMKAADGTTVAFAPTAVAALSADPGGKVVHVHTTGGVRHEVTGVIDDVIKLVEDGLALWAGLGL